MHMHLLRSNLNTLVKTYPKFHWVSGTLCDDGCTKSLKSIVRYSKRPICRSHDLINKIRLSRTFFVKMSTGKESQLSENVYQFEAADIDGRNRTMQEFSGNALLIANVACKCGLTTANYTQLSQLAEKYESLKVLLFPCNQARKERTARRAKKPGTPEEIKKFAEPYSDKLVLFGKINVNGASAHPLFQYLKKKCPGTLVNTIKWNFTKFLVDKNGVPVARYGPKEEPLSFEKEIQKLLA